MIESRRHDHGHRITGQRPALDHPLDAPIRRRRPDATRGRNDPPIGSSAIRRAKGDILPGVARMHDTFGSESEIRNGDGYFWLSRLGAQRAAVEIVASAAAQAHLLHLVADSILNASGNARILYANTVWVDGR